MKNLVEHSARVASSDHIQIKTEGLYVQPSDAYECLNAACYILGHPTMAILGPTSKVNVDSIQSLASAREIPHILTDYVGPLTGKTQLSFHPSIELMTKAYIDVLSTMNWKMFTILHTSEHRITWGNFIEEAQKAGFIFDIKLLNPHHFT